MRVHGLLAGALGGFLSAVADVVGDGVLSVVTFGSVVGIAVKKNATPSKELITTIVLKILQLLTMSQSCTKSSYAHT